MEQKADTKNLVMRNSTWHLNAMVNGVMIRRSLKTSDLGEARKKRDLILLPLQANADERQMLASVRRQLEGIKSEEEQRRKEEQKGVRLDSAWRFFVKDPHRRQCKDQQLKIHESNWTGFLKWLNKRYPTLVYCKELSRAICTEWAGDLLDSVKATNTYNHHVASVRLVLSAICNLYEDFRNPMEQIHCRKDSDCISKEPFSSEELNAIFATKDEEFKLLCAIGLYTTLRLGSARKVKWEMFDKNLSFLVAIHNKTGADASQEVAAELRELLQSIPPEKRVGYVCPTYAEKPTAAAALMVQQHLVALGIQTHREIAGINGQIRNACVKGFHSFRHTAITLALKNGATISQVKRLAGHASERMQGRYTHLGADDAGKANALIGRFW